MKYIANSIQKQDLKSHLLATMHVAMYCAKNILGINDEELVNIIGLSAFLHDIGKATTYFQNVTLETEYGEKPDNNLIKKFYPNWSSGSYPRHNEISWLYAHSHAKSKSKKGTVKFKDIGPQSIYWHHGTYLYSSEILDQKTPRTSQEIIKEFAAFDESEYNAVSSKIDDVIKSVSFPFEIDKYLEEDVDESTVQIPRVFDTFSQVNDIINAQRFVSRSCIIFADHLVSRLSNEEIEDLLDNNVQKYIETNNNSKNIDFILPKEYNKERFETQKQIVNDCGRTTIVKAPAGFGKSLIGVIWGIKQSGQIYWVCPRNAVAEGVYDNILQEIKTFGLNISVELYLTSERKKATDNSIKPCKSDIVVTNIDNLLSPMVNYKDTGRLFDINMSNVVFDEFHEFNSDNALFGAFAVYMKARNLLCSNCKTLLLSATPSILHVLWEGKNKTTILPNEHEHYKAQHSVPYTFEFLDSFVKNTEVGSLTMYCSIANVQNNYALGYNHITHSKYNDRDRSKKLDVVKSLFGKHGNKNGTVISAPILQAALDISFKSLYKTVESPECDLQTFGRINRWGETDSLCKIRMINNYDNDSERQTIVTRYNLNLSKMWYKFLTENICDQTTLDEIYTLYNSFNEKYKKEIGDFIRAQYEKSIEDLSIFFPIQRNIKKSEKIIASKTLRNSCGSYFAVVKNKKDGKWCDFVFSVDSREIDDMISYHRPKYEGNNLLTIFENLEQITDENGENKYDYSEIRSKFFKKKTKKRFEAEFLKSYARCAESPMPCFSKKYCEILGLLDCK